MNRWITWRDAWQNIADNLAAMMLTAMFVTFLLQIFSRYVLQQPFSWTLELCLMLWVYLVFFGSSFIIRDEEHIRFDILYSHVSPKKQRLFRFVSHAILLTAMVYAFLPTLDYIQFLQIKKTAALKIRYDWFFGIYLIFMLSLMGKCLWQMKIALHADARNDSNSDS